jgi:hypothetical protein
VASNGRLVPGHEAEALRRHRSEGTPLRGERVDMRTPLGGQTSPDRRTRR